MKNGWNGMANHLPIIQRSLAIVRFYNPFRLMMLHGMKHIVKKIDK